MPIIKRKFRISRRTGASLWGQQKDPANAKNYPPGESGVHGFKKKSDFGKQFAMHKKFKAYYNMKSKQMKSIFDKASTRKGDAGDNFIAAMESRLCTVLYRANLAPTIFAARQFISHKHVTVNGCIVNVASYILKKGDKVKITGKLASSPVILSHASSKETAPDYLEVNPTDLEAVFLRTPSYSEVPYPSQMLVKLLIEFYSR